MNYPPGAANDPRAPWNQPDPIACDECEGVGCETCEGEGCVAPPTREEIAEERADREYDRERDEGRL